MSALPGGWLDTGVTVTQSVSADFAHRGTGHEVLSIEGFVIGDDATGAFTPGCAAGSIGYEVCGSFAGGVYTPGFSAGYTRYIRGYSESYAARTLIDSVSGSCAGTYFSPFTVTKSVGPLRLGVTILDGSAIRYALFADPATALTLTLPGGRSSTAFPWASVTNIGQGVALDFSMIPVPVGPGPAHYPVAGGYTTSEVVSVSSLAFSVSGRSGSVDLSNFGAGAYYSASGGAILMKLGVEQAWSPGSYPVPLFAAPSVEYSYSLRHTDANGADVASAMDLKEGTSVSTVTLSGAGATTGTRRVPQSSWDPAWDPTGVGAPLSVALNDPWCASVDPEPYAADRPQKIRCPQPKVGAGGALWAPISLSPSGSLSILQSANSFIGAGTLTVAGLVWTVTVAGASVSRALASHWRNWNDPLDSLYQSADGWKATKHDFYASGAGDDVWGWGMYASLDVDLDAPTTAPLTFTATVVVSGDGGADPSFARSFTIIPAVGHHTYRLDLMFPDGKPLTYIERVDAVAFSGLDVGVYTLHSLTLKTSAPGCATVHPRARGVAYSQDSQYVFSQWGTDPLTGSGASGVDPSTGYPTGARYTKEAENGLFFYDDGVDPPATSSYGGSPQLAGTIQDVATELSRVEGLGASYAAGTIAADMSDGFGNVIGLDAGGLVPTPTAVSAGWLLPVMPCVAVPSGGTTSLSACPLMDSKTIVPGGTGLFDLTVLAEIGMMVEGVAIDASGARVTSGPTLFVRKSFDGVARPGDPLLGSAAAGAAGYFVVGIPTGLSPNSGTPATFFAYLSET